MKYLTATSHSRSIRFSKKHLQVHGNHIYKEITQETYGDIKKFGGGAGATRVFCFVFKMGNFLHILHINEPGYLDPNLKIIVLRIEFE